MGDGRWEMEVGCVMSEWWEVRGRIGSMNGRATALCRYYLS